MPAEYPAATETSRGGSDEPTNQSQSRARMGAVPGVRVIGTGSFVPEKLVTNEDLSALGCDSEWIVRRTGIRQRRHASPGEATSDLCYQAALRCLDDAGVEASQLDLIIVATMTPDHPTPSTACEIQRRLDAVAPAMDVNAACAGFMYGMITAAQFIAAGNSQCALVIGADVMTGTVNPADVKTYPLFGDAAGAVIMTPDGSAPDGSTPPRPEASSATRPPRDGILSYELGSEGCGGAMLCVPAGGTRQPLTPEAHAAGRQFLEMDGRNVFKWAVRLVDESAKNVLADAGLQADELALVVLHQANVRIMDAAVAGLDLKPDQLFVNLDRFGNTSAASIPLALDEAARQGRLQPGDLVLLCGFGAGLAWGTAILKW